MQPDEPGHYGKLDHSGKKTNTLPVADPGSSEYGKLDRVCVAWCMAWHTYLHKYMEYVHCDVSPDQCHILSCTCMILGCPQSQMEDPLHYGKLDHPGKRGATLPGGVAPTDPADYGKLDNVRNMWCIDRCG